MMMNKIYPTTEEINNAWDILRKATNNVELSFYIFKEEDLLVIAELIRHMDNFNNKNNEVIANEIIDFFNALPKIDYGEGNPNNGGPVFNRIVLRGDDTITIFANGFSNDFEKHDWNMVNHLVDETGVRWEADEHSLTHKELNWGLEEYSIRFWWD